MGNLFSFVKNIPCWGYRAAWRWTKWSLSYAFIIFRKRKSRVFKYDMTADGEPFKAGFFIPPEEWDLECFAEKQVRNEIFCFGINSSGDCLALLIAKECACDLSTSLLLKVNGLTYNLPLQFDYMTTNDKHVIGSNRCFMQCIAPFRKWKIFFNGMLREMYLGLSGNDCDRIVHAKFSFIWVASCGVFDFLSDYSSYSMADILSEIRWNCLKPPISRILSALNEYHQPGMMHGIVQIESEPEQEISLWGCRRHAFGTRKEDFDSLLDIFGNTETGFFFHFKVMSIGSSVMARNTIGYVMQVNGSLKSVRCISVRRITAKRKDILYFRMKTGGFYYNIAAFFYDYGGLFGRGRCENRAISVIDVLVNGVWGSGIAVERKTTKRVKCHEEYREIITCLRNKLVSGLELDPLIVSLEDPRCLNKILSGNLGSILAKLTQMQDYIIGYDVPHGFVITTYGCEEYYSSVQQSVGILKENSLKYGMDEMIPLCERIVEEISNFYFPPALYEYLCEHLNKILKDAENNSFNIYPSIAGPDTEVQLLEAYLDIHFGVVGLPEVVKSIKKCWASQFSFGAVQCKRSAGLPLSISMAVIVQKTVNFDTSGVISTCESSSGNPSIMEIREEIQKTSGAIRIIRLKRGLKSQIFVLDINLLNDFAASADDDSNGDNHDNDSDKNDSQEKAFLLEGKKSLSDIQAVFLGKLACKLEACFQFPLGVEWCLRNDNFFIIQIRPITFINAEPKSEIFHYCDTFTRTEDDWYSLSYTGEAFLGPISPLGMNIISFCIEIFIARMKYVNSDLWITQTPYFPKFLIFSHYYMMYCMADGLLRLLCLSGNTFFKTLLFIVNFRPGTEDVFLEFLSHRHACKTLSFKMILKSILVLLTSGRRSKQLEKEISKFDFNVENIDSAADVLDALSKKYQHLTEAFVSFMNCTYRAVLWNMLIFYILGKIIKYKENIYKDFNFLMSACSTPEEENIAVDLLVVSNKIAEVIDPRVFATMPIEDAKVWLEDVEIDKKVQFSYFLKNHGHRCDREIDIFQKCWTMDPTSIIRILQVIASDSPYSLKHTSCSLNPAFDQLSVVPNFFQKLILKYAVPKCVKSLREAKKAKSDLLKMASVWRQVFHHLANKAVVEFRIPFPEALFFLSLEEINQLLKTESPHLVTKALKCWEVRADLDECIFPVMAIGHPFPLDVNYYIEKRLQVDSFLRGCPVSRGSAVGTAVVITNFNETRAIKKGSILITRSPSIVWSLYFPILGGFATDLGGLLSDGAVAAREYGLPCVINLVRASQVLKTGDHVFLDGNVGILRRVSD